MRRRHNSIGNQYQGNNELTAWVYLQRAQQALDDEKDALMHHRRHGTAELVACATRAVANLEKELTHMVKFVNATIERGV